MGMNLSQVVAEARDGDRVAVSLTTNEDDGIASYAEGDLVFHAASTERGNKRGTFHRASLSTSNAKQLSMFFSDRRIGTPGPPGGFGGLPRQPFSADATEALGASLSVGFGHPVLTIQLFGNKAHFPVAPMGNLLVGAGPQFGKSAEAVWVLAFIGVIRAPG